MATTYKVLGQLAPAATTESTLYTVPAATSAVSSSIVICNQAAAPATFRIAVVKSGGATVPAAALSWIVYGTTVAANDSTILTMGLTLATGDKVQVYSSSATLSFQIFGSELA